jgi:hypothetical protein
MYVVLLVDIDRVDKPKLIQIDWDFGVMHGANGFDDAFS